MSRKVLRNKDLETIIEEKNEFLVAMSRKVLRNKSLLVSTLPRKFLVAMSRKVLRNKANSK